MAVSPLSSSSFEKALAAFKARSGLTAKQLSEMEVTTLTDLRITLAAMQKSQQQSRTLRHLGRLQPFLDAMEQYGKVIEIFVNVSDVVAFIWGPIKFVLLTVTNVADAFNIILESYLSIGEHMPLLGQYRQLFEQNRYMQTALALIFEDILEFHLEAVRLFTQKTWKQLFHATQRTLTKRVEQITKSIARHRAIIKEQTTIVQYEEFRASHALMKAEFLNARQAERDQRRTRVQNWLGLTIDSLSRHEDVKRVRFGNTGQWLLDDIRFQEWFRPDQCSDPMLWLHGMPGAGKTVLASRVIEEIQALKGAVGVYFYCKHMDEQKNSEIPLMRSIISQVLALNDSILDYLYEEMSASGQATLGSFDLVKKLTEISLRSCRKAYIVIDGLDEYSRESRKNISLWFQDLIYRVPRINLGSLRCLFVSQEDGASRKDLSTIPQIKITPTENHRDIEAFCADWHRQIESKFGPTLNPVHHVTQVVSARAAGMFLYAKLVTWNLYEQTSRAAFEAEMRPDRIPDDLNQAYHRIVERLLGSAASASRRDNIKRLLGWLACARRPLRWYEIQAAVAVDLDTGSFSAKHRFQEDCKDLCASLVDVLSDQTVTLVHTTAKDYLIRNNFILLPEANCDLAMVCLTYLNMQEFEMGRSDDEIQSAYVLGFYAFAEYAICYWPLHVESAYRGLKTTNVDLITGLSENFETFLEIHWVVQGQAEVPSTKLQEHLSALRSHDFFEKACEAIATAKSWLRPTGRDPDNCDILRLPRMIVQLRNVFERLVTSTSSGPTDANLITNRYGNNHYKCARLNCQFFHRGFISGLQRDQHTTKHDRSFTCTWDGCPYELFGFTTKEGLRKHSIEQHGLNLGEDKLVFPELKDPDSDANQKSPNNLKCEICGKKFTRAFNLKSHLKTHTTDRPYVCTSCGKGFTRQNDCVRHERIHTGERKFICHGVLDSETGQTWGCGRQFSRSDTLALHFQSEAGKMCIAPLRAKESASKQNEADHASSPLTQQNELVSLPTLAEMPSPVLTNNPILPYLDWEHHEDVIWNEWAIRLDQVEESQEASRSPPSLETEQL